jgi:hypothetical protein
MAKRYHQSRADRLDESLGERRGKESSKKQSYASRRHESRGARKDEHHERDEDHPTRHMGHGEFANMPSREIFKAYPRQPQDYGEYDDTIRGIDEVETESYKKRDSYPSRQK